MTNAEVVANLGHLISPHLERIERLFKDPKVTLIVRAPNRPEGDVVMGNDDLDEAIAAIQRLKDRPPTFDPHVR